MYYICKLNEYILILFIGLFICVFVMKDSQVKNSITFLFLILFLSMKMIGLHALTHEEEDKDHAIHCTICDNAIIQNLTPALTPDSQDFSIENTEFVINRSIIKQYSFITSNTIASSQLFSRPPPFLL